MRALLLSVLAAALPVQAQVSQNMTLLGRWDQRSSYGDIWGYVAPNGDEYALIMSRDDGLSVIDLNGANPVEVGFIPNPSGAFDDSKDVETWGTTAYIVNEYANMQVVDLTDPDNPVQVRTFDTQPGVSGGGSHTLSVADGYLYVQGGAGTGGVRIFSLANPLNPQFVGDYQPFYVHDVYVRGDVLYAAAIYGEGVDIVDISDKANPTRIELFNYPGSGAHNVCATEDGSHIFVGDEIGWSGNWTRTFNVEDPQDVELVSQVVVNPNAIVHNCNVEGDLLYLAHYTEGVRVWDVSDPTDPSEVAYYDTYPGSFFGYDGAWSVYPYLPSGRIIASDISTGLYVLRLDLAATVTAGIAPVGSTTVPAAGGPISFTATLTNAGSVSQTVDAWVVARLPNGSEYPRAIEGPLAVTLAAGQTVGPVSFTEAVPASAPPGVYTVELRVGDYPSRIDATDSFTFTKSAAEAVAAVTAEAAGVALGAYPNPATGRTAVRFTLEEAGDVRLVVYDALGREAAVLVDGERPAGPHEAVFDGTALPGGTYFVRLDAGGRVERRTLTLLR